MDGLETPRSVCDRPVVFQLELRAGGCRLLGSGWRRCCGTRELGAACGSVDGDGSGTLGDGEVCSMVW
jgi:hypothetical protein